jgi:hypothetical protein
VEIIGLESCLVAGFGIMGYFALGYCVQTGSGAHPASYRMGTLSPFPGLKLPGREGDH